MYSINTIKGMNEAAYLKAQKAQLTHGMPESETSRRCSYVESSRGIVLHSAKRRSTVQVKGARNEKLFLASIHSTNSLGKRDEIIESYFS